MMRCHRQAVGCVAAAFLFLGPAIIRSAHAVVSYTSVGSSYTQNFDTLPTSPTNVSLGSTPAGWVDDSTSPGSNYSIPGWYLYHSADLSSGEGGSNGHQRLRIGAGTANTGAFMSWGTAASSDRALGALTSSTTGETFYGVRLRNNTGITLGQLTLSYTAEQWRDGGGTVATPSVAQSVSFGYAVTSSSPTNIGDFSAGGNTGGITGVTTVGSLGFTSPQFGATTADTTATIANNHNVRDGNAAANRVVIAPITFGGFTWAPGQDLWLRWDDIDHSGNDHGMGIDDLTFSANVAVEVNSIANGVASSPSTWSDNQAPGPVKNYHVVGGNTVTLDNTFTGDILSVENGSVDINSAGNGKSFTLLSVENGGNLTESVNGDFTLGTATSSLRVNRNITFNGFEPGSKFTLAADVSGSGNMDFNSNGAGSELILSRVGGHTGIIRFNGTGDTVRLQGPEGFNTVEMNSTGANTFSYEPTSGSVNAGTLIFNQPGKLVHAAPNDRLQGGTLSLVANAPVTVDLTNFFSGDERRMLIGDELGAVTGHLQGSANVTVNGTTSAPAGGNITRNEFEIGGTSPEPAAEITDPYSGTMTLNDYVNVEVRHNLPNAKIVINNNALLDMGHQVVTATQSIKIGAIEVNNGGTLEVGFEQSSATNNGHHAYHLTLTGDGSRHGDLTLHDGATTVMQINGLASTQFDRITAAGNVVLDGTLNVLVNPVASSGTNPIYSATIGDVFDIISTAGGALAGDYNQNGSVGQDDYNLWRSTFGSTVTAGTGADGNGDGIVDASDFAFWRKNNGHTAGLITGTFDALNIVDTNGALAAAGATLQIVYASSTLVQLKVVALGSGTSLSTAVPEPGTFALVALVLPTLLFSRRRVEK